MGQCVSRRAAVPTGPGSPSLAGSDEAEPEGAGEASASLAKNLRDAWGVAKPWGKAGRQKAAARADNTHSATFQDVRSGKNATNISYSLPRIFFRHRGDRITPPEGGPQASTAPSSSAAPRGETASRRAGGAAFSQSTPLMGNGAVTSGALHACSAPQANGSVASCEVFSFPRRHVQAFLREMALADTRRSTRASSLEGDASSEALAGPLGRRSDDSRTGGSGTRLGAEERGTGNHKSFTVHRRSSFAVADLYPDQDVGVGLGGSSEAW